MTTITIIITTKTTATITITIIISSSANILIFYFHAVIIALLEVNSSLFLKNIHAGTITERFLTAGNSSQDSSTSVKVCDKWVIVATWLVQSTEVIADIFRTVHYRNIRNVDSKTQLAKL
jgi:hypothetical protein